MANNHKWPAGHRNLLAVVILLTIAAIACIYLRLRPRWLEYTETRDEKASIEAKLIKSEWPNDPERLEAILKGFTKQLGDKEKGLKVETAQIIAKATGMFKERIENEYETIPDFIQRASQTEYKDQYDRLDTYLQGRSIILDTSVFGMNELTSEPFKYQMLLKLWTTQAIVDCALDNKLRVTSKPLAGSRGRRASSITVLPMKSYYLNENDATPYVLEFPVQLEIIGSMANFSAFVDSLFTEGRFLPITNMELIAQPPQGGKLPGHDKEGIINYHTIRVQIICSSFFLPQTLPQKEVTSPKAVVSERPAGI